MSLTDQKKRTLPRQCCCCCSLAKSCPTLCDPVDCSRPGFPVHHHLPEFTQTHIMSQWCYPNISFSVVPFSSCLQCFLATGSFPMSQLFAWPHGLFVTPWAEHTRLPCPSLSPKVFSNPCPFSRWCHPTISSSTAFSFCFQSFPASASFAMSQQFAIRWPKYWNFSISPSSEYSGLISLEFTGLISLLTKGLPRVFSSTTVWKHQFFGMQLIYGPILTSIHDYWKKS